MDVEHRRELFCCYRDGLLEDTLPFWIGHGVDHEHGGIITSLDRDGSIVDTDKGIWQQGRFSWLCGKLYNSLEPRPQWLELARASAEFLDQFGFDAADGRMWFEVTRQGEPLRKRRYAFSESFAAIAYGELARAMGSKQYAAKARGCFDRFRQHHAQTPAVLKKFTDTRPQRDLAVPMITIATAQQLRDSIGLSGAGQLIDESIAAIRRYHLDNDRRCVLETVGVDGEFLEHFDGRTLNPGHAIEAAWFIMEEGRIRDNPELVNLGCTMLDWMWQRGWDQQYGGTLSFVSVDDRPVQQYWHDMKFWWPQNETIIATLMAYRLSGDPKYERMHRQVHDWAHQNFADPTHGEWFGYLHRDGSRSSSLKGNLWKGPFHLPRMQWICSEILEADW